MSDGGAHLGTSGARKAEIDQDDNELLAALTTTAEMAINHASLLEDTRRRRQWSAASAEITSALLSNIVDDALGFIADRVVDLADADLVSVVLRKGPHSLLVETSRGSLADQVLGLVVPLQGTLAQRAIESGHPVVADSNALADGTRSPWIELGPTMAIPLAGSGQLLGVLTVSRVRGSSRFTQADVHMAAEFAGQASIALALSKGREDQTKLALFEDRARIARDLHDHVIQRLFSTGLSLQLLDVRPDDHITRAGITAAVKVLDDTIAEIRTTIFDLVSPSVTEHGSLRHGIIDVVAESSMGLASSPRVVFTGPVDLLVPVELSTDILAVVRESLTNVAKHARAGETMLSVAVTDDTISVDVTDDGIGTPDVHRASGTKNLERRAVALGGEFYLRSRNSGGSHLHWCVPLVTNKE